MRYKKVQEHCKLLTFCQTLREPYDILQSKLLVYTYLLAIVSLGIVYFPGIQTKVKNFFTKTNLIF